MIRNVVVALVMLTSLDGSPVWIESSAVTMIRPAITQCHVSHGAALRVGATAICVRETPAQIRDKLNERGRP